MEEDSEKVEADILNDDVEDETNVPPFSPIIPPSKARMFNTNLFASSSQSMVSRQEPLPIQKIESLANGIKLEGTKNCLSCSRRAMLVLQTKGAPEVYAIELHSAS